MFILQTDNGFLSEDVNTVRECIDEYNWMHFENQELFLTATLENLDEGVSKAVPVGTIEFVETLMHLRNPYAKIKPINIPTELMKPEFLGRKVLITSDIKAVEQAFTPFFIKSNTTCKADYSGIFRGTQSILEFPNDEYFTSEVLKDLKSEWRVFVNNGNIMDVRCYIGNPWIIPDKATVTHMVNEYHDCPPAYTLDVGVTVSENKTQTVIIEVHNFIACGLYGFHNMAIPHMLKSAYKYEIQQTRKI